MNEDYNNQKHQITYSQQGQQLQSQQPQVQPLQGQQQYQQYGQQPFYTSPQYGVCMPIPGNGSATASLVCGILSLILPFVSLILGIIAIATGASAKRNGFLGGKATAGIVMGIIGTAWNAVLVFSSLMGLIALI